MMSKKGYNAYKGTTDAVAAPEVSNVAQLENQIVREAYLVTGTKQTLADLWRLVEKHKAAKLDAVTS